MAASSPPSRAVLRATLEKLEAGARRGPKSVIIELAPLFADC
jgi:hypothetical protein